MSSAPTKQPTVKSSNKVIHCEDSASFCKKNNRTTFIFFHGLVGHLLSEIHRLVTLANRMRLTTLRIDALSSRDYASLTHSIKSWVYLLSSLKIDNRFRFKFSFSK